MAPASLLRQLFWEPRQSTGNNQIASEKDYPLDISHFNITGRVFGAQGVDETQSEATIFNVNLERTNGSFHLVKLALPVILPALLDWEFELAFTDDGFKKFSQFALRCPDHDFVVQVVKQLIANDRYSMRTKLLDEVSSFLPEAGLKALRT